MNQKTEIPIQCIRCKATDAKISASIGEPFDMCSVCSHICEECPQRTPQDKVALMPEPVLPTPHQCCLHMHTYHTGGFHFSEGVVWDDVEEVCIDCGEVLE